MDESLLRFDDELEFDPAAPFQDVVAEFSDPKVTLGPLGSPATDAEWVPSPNYLMTADEPEFLIRFRLVSDSNSYLAQVLLGRV